MSTSKAHQLARRCLLFPYVVQWFWEQHCDPCPTVTLPHTLPVAAAAPLCAPAAPWPHSWAHLLPPPLSPLALQRLHGLEHAPSGAYWVHRANAELLRPGNPHWLAWRKVEAGGRGGTGRLQRSSVFPVHRHLLQVPPSLLRGVSFCQIA